MAVRSAIIPMLQEVQFLLGFCSSSQIVRKLNSYQGDRSATATSDPGRLFPAWVTVRLRSGVRPEVLLDELETTRDRLKFRDHKVVLTDVLVAFGLAGRNLGATFRSELGFVTPVDAPAQPSLTPDPPIVASAPAKIRKQPNQSGSTSKASRLKWWSHKRNSTTEVRARTPDTDSDRRPSLPIELTFGRQPRRSTTSLGSSGASGSVLSDGSDSTAASDLLASLLAFENAAEKRVIILDHLLKARFDVWNDLHDDWFLGLGKVEADQILAWLEKRLVGKRDVMDLKTVFVELRALFHLPVYVVPFSSRGSRYRAKGLLAVPPLSVTPSPPQDSVSSSPRDGTGSVASQYTAVSTSPSFDLDQYLCDITPSVDGHDSPPQFNPHPESPAKEDCLPLTAPRRRAASNDGIVVTTGIVPTTSAHLQRSSFLSTYTIEEAKESLAQEVVLSISKTNRPNSLVMRDGFAGLDRYDALGREVPVTAAAGSLAEWLKKPPTMYSLRKGIASQPDLIAPAFVYQPKPKPKSVVSPVKVDSPGSPPDEYFPSLRRNRHNLITSRPSAWEMRSKAKSPPPPIVPPKLPTFRHQLGTPINATFGTSGGRSLPNTPLQQGRGSTPEMRTPKYVRNANRDCTIVDGTISPSLVPLDKGVIYDAVPGTPGSRSVFGPASVSKSGSYFAGNAPGPTKLSPEYKPLPRVPGPQTHSPPPPLHHKASQPTTIDASPLAKMLSLFEVVGGVSQVKSHLTLGDFEAALGQIIGSMDHVVAQWVLDQVETMVSLVSVAYQKRKTLIRGERRALRRPHCPLPTVSRSTALLRVPANGPC